MGVQTGFCQDFRKGCPLTLFRPGGGRIPPAATLNVNNFFNIKANATKLGDFLPKNYLTTI